MKNLIIALFFCGSGLISVVNGITVLTYDERFNRYIIATLFVFTGLILLTEGVSIITRQEWIKSTQIIIFTVYSFVGILSFEVIRTDKNRKKGK